MILQDGGAVVRDGRNSASGVSLPTFEIVKPGVQTTVQDGGRPGYLARGIPPSGAQDYLSLALASRLVGNEPPPPPLSLGSPGDAGLEFLLQGPKITFRTDTVVAVTGADFPVKLDNDPVPMWTSLAVRAGQVLEVGVARRGLRGYLAIAGGIDVPEWLGSRSTYVRGMQGGHEGRPLARGDVLSVFEPPSPESSIVGRQVPEVSRPDLAAVGTLRVVLGPQDYLLTDASLETFLTSSWTLTSESDRMGFRLAGPEMEFKPRADYLVREAGALPSNIVLDVTPIGGIQVTTGNEAIIMGGEVPSIGGFAKPATMISADQCRIGQVRPGEEIRFEVVSADEAVRIGEELRMAVLTADLEPVTQEGEGR